MISSQQPPQPQPFRVNNGIKANGNITNTTQNDGMNFQRKNLNFSLTNIDNAENKFTHNNQPSTNILKTTSSLTNTTSIGGKDENNELSFFEVLSRIQSNRLDDQRCSIKSKSLIKNELFNETNNNKYINDEANLVGKLGSTMPNDDFFNLIIKSQRTRLEDQRSSIAAPLLLQQPPIKSASSSSSSTSSTSSSSAIISSSSSSHNNNFQSQHILASTASSSSSSSLTNSIKQLDPSNKELNVAAANKSSKMSKQAITVPPDDEFFSMIQKIQSRRLDEQRTSIRPSNFKKAAPQIQPMTRSQMLQ